MTTNDKITTLLERREAAEAAYAQEIKAAHQRGASHCHISALEQDLQLILFEMNREFNGLLSEQRKEQANG